MRLPTDPVKGSPETTPSPNYTKPNREKDNRTAHPHRTPNRNITESNQKQNGTSYCTQHTPDNPSYSNVDYPSPFVVAGEIPPTDPSRSGRNLPERSHLASAAAVGCCIVGGGVLAAVNFGEEGARGVNADAAGVRRSGTDIVPGPAEMYGFWIGRGDR